MSESAIRAALERHLKTISAPTVAAWPTAFENVGFDEPGGKQYQKAFVLFAKIRPAGFGKKATEFWSGTFQINVQTAGNAGAGIAEQRSKAIRAHFARGAALFDADSTVKVICEMPYPGRAMESESAYVLPVIIPWFCYVQP